MHTKFRQRRAGLLGVTLAALPWCGLAHAAGAAGDQAVPATSRQTSQQASQPAQADKTDAAQSDAVQSVVVTAERRTQPLQRSSLSATVLSGDDLLRAGVNVVDQLQYVTPSTAANNYGQGVNITIRGIGKAETNTQTKTGVITYRDGVATSPGYFGSEPYYDMASVQILRGPQGTFGGQNATGGAILADSNDPVIHGNGGYLLGQVGNYSDVLAQGAVNVPISDTLAARVAFNSENRDSFFHVTGPYTGGNGALRARSLRVGLLWKPVKALSVLFKQDMNHIDMGGYPNSPVGSTADLFSVTTNADQLAKDRFGRSTLKVEYTFDDGSRFRSVSGRQTGTTAYAGDLDGTSSGNVIFRDSTDERLYSQEFDLISSDAGPFTWLAGAYFNKDEFTVLPGNLVSGIPGNPLTVYSFYGTTPSRTKAAFGQVAYQLSDGLKLAVDGRYSKNRTNLDLDIQQYGLALTQRQSVDFRSLSGKVALDWTLDKHNFVYGFVASASRPGGLNAPVGLGPASPFDSERVTSVEFGWKADWMGGHVRTQTSAFYNRYNNFQVTIGYPTLPVFGVEVNTPNATRIYGLEQQLQAQFGDGWSMHANLGLMHSALGRFFATDPRVPAVVACNPQTGPASASCVALADHKQTYAPDFTFNVGVDRRIVMGEYVVTPRINYAHVSSQWATLFENPALGDRLGSRNLSTAQVDVEHGDLTATLYATNLTNLHYVSSIAGGLRYAGPPRQYGLRVTKFF